MAKQLKVEFIFERETKGAVKYAEVNDKGLIVTDYHNATIGSLYIRKSALDGDAIPQSLTVHINLN